MLSSFHGGDELHRHLRGVWAPSPSTSFTSNEGALNSFYTDNENVIELVIIILGCILGVSLLYYCCCKADSEQYDPGVSVSRKKPTVIRFDDNIIDDEESIERTSLDEITEKNTTINATTKFLSPEQYMALFKGNYHYNKSRRTSVHALRLGLNKKQSLMTDISAYEEIQMTELMPDDSVEDEHKARATGKPRKWVTWSDLADGTTNERMDLLGEEEHNSEEEIKEDLCSNANNERFNCVEEESEGLQPSFSLMHSTTLDEDTEVVGYNPQAEASLIESATSIHGPLMQSQLNGDRTKQDELTEDKKKFQNMFRSSSFNPADNSKRRSSLSNKPSESEALLSEDVRSSLSTRGSGLLNPAPTRFSPPPSLRSSPQLFGKGSCSPLKRQTSFEFATLAEKLKKAQQNSFRKKTSFRSLNPSDTSRNNSSEDIKTVENPTLEKSTAQATHVVEAPNGKRPAASKVSRDDESDPLPSSLLQSRANITDPPPPPPPPPPSRPLGVTTEKSPQKASDIFMPTQPPPPAEPKAKQPVSPSLPGKLTQDKTASIASYLEQGSSPSPSVDIAKYCKMLKVGMPLEAVKYKMELAGINPELLDSHVDMN